MGDLDEAAPDDIEDRGWLDLSLATVSGHTRTATALRERVLGCRHETGIILHGPKSVGKRTLARLYARAVLCETPTEAGEACGACGQCLSFIASRPVGYTWLDVINHGDADTARKLVSELNGGSVAARRVLVVANADRYTNGVFDALLKTLEEPKGPITFILLARVLAEVRLAGQSRCELHRLRPLAPEAAREHLGALLSAHGVRVDEGVIDVLAAETGGRVGAMQNIVKTVAALPAKTLTDVRIALGHDWVERVAAFWRAELSADHTPPEALASPPGDHARLAQGRVQAVLLRLRPPAGLEASALRLHGNNAALVHRDAILGELSGMLAARATASERSMLDLWGALAGLWLSDDHGDAEGLREATSETRRILNLPRLESAPPCAADNPRPPST